MNIQKIKWLKELYLSNKDLIFNLKIKPVKDRLINLASKEIEKIYQDLFTKDVQIVSENKLGYHLTSKGIYQALEEVCKKGINKIKIYLKFKKEIVDFNSEINLLDGQIRIYDEDIWIFYDGPKMIEILQDKLKEHFKIEIINRREISGIYLSFELNFDI